ncbi:hypothetical protein VM95_25925 [Streptomyces rubellomurinus]|uniref:Uncharacterized protein n=1 Tax=Streptomyces rubellomurinus (strain ATCC 31215) TaxID=359131 RepID=A0A0F2TD51_STRR3|nr:hypothetical protein VM95_25925 [Streptomyces rubellomurinus]
MEVWEFAGEHYCLQSTELVDGSRYFELSEARAAPAGWTTGSGGGDFMPGPAAVTVVAMRKEEDEDEEKLPFVTFAADRSLPFDILSRFTARISELLDGEGVEPAG